MSDTQVPSKDMSKPERNNYPPDFFGDRQYSEAMNAWCREQFSHAQTGGPADGLCGIKGCTKPWRHPGDCAHGGESTHEPESEQQSHTESDGCPTEMAVLKRFWREHRPTDTRPTAWMRGHRSYRPGEPDDYDVECVYGDDPPDESGTWIPLYHRPCVACAEFVRMQHDIASLLGVDDDTDSIDLHGRIYEALSTRAPPPPSSDDARDAARYRFLRQPNHAIVYARDPNAWGHNTPGHIRYNTPEQLDAAIDAACSGTTKGDGPPAMDTPVDGVPGMTIAEYMRAAVSSATKAGADNPCITGYWFCTNCQLCNSETIHHTSCPTCGSLRPTSGEIDGR